MICYVCKGYVFKWRPDDDPLEEHKTLYKNKCTLMQGFIAQQVIISTNNIKKYNKIGIFFNNQ